MISHSREKIGRIEQAFLREIAAGACAQIDRAGAIGGEWFEPADAMIDQGAAPIAIDQVHAFGRQGAVASPALLLHGVGAQLIGVADRRFALGMGVVRQGVQHHECAGIEIVENAVEMIEKQRQQMFDPLTANAGRQRGIERIVTGGAKGFQVLLAETFDAGLVHADFRHGREVEAADLL